MGRKEHKNLEGEGGELTLKIPVVDFLLQFTKSHGFTFLFFFFLLLSVRSKAYQMHCDEPLENLLDKVLHGPRGEGGGDSRKQTVQVGIHQFKHQIHRVRH